MKVGNYIISHKPKKGSIIHEKLEKQVEEVVHLKNFGTLYQFSNILDMPVERYQRLAQFENEYYNRFQYNNFVEVIDSILKQLNAGDLSKASYILHSTKQIIENAYDVNTIYRVIACHFFTLEEPIVDYDYDYNERKIEALRTSLHESTDKSLAFFFGKSNNRLLNQILTSNVDLRDLEKLQQVRDRFAHTLTS